MKSRIVQSGIVTIIGEFIVVDEFKSIREAARNNNLNRSTLSKILNGKRKINLRGNFNWRFKPQR